MRALAWILLVPLLVLGCAGPDLKPGEGFVGVPGGPVWYRVIGAGEGIPVLMVHGGPGIRSCYLERLALRLGAKRPVVLYDQLGSGRSGRPMEPSLWTVDRFVRELAAVRAALHLDRIHLLGHSWGTALVADYVTRQRPGGVASIVFASPYFSSRQWAEDAEYLRARLPRELRETLLRHERAGTTQSREYQEAVHAYNDRHLFPSKPAPIASCAQAPRNDEIYELMWGPSDFRSTGSLRDYDITARLPKLPGPVLFITGRHDTARPETAARYRAMVPGARLEILEHSGHLGPMEEPERMAELLEAFFAGIEPRNPR